MFCKHEWKVVTQQKMEAPIKHIDNANSIGFEGKLYDWMLKEKSIIILNCSKCGKLNKTITTNP